MLLLRQRLLHEHIQLALPSRFLSLPSSSVIHRLPYRFDDHLQIRLKSKKAKSAADLKQTFPHRRTEATVQKPPRPIPWQPKVWPTQAKEAFINSSPFSANPPSKPSPKKRPAAAPRLRKGEEENRIYARLSPTGEFIQDLVEWRRSKYFLSILINSAAFVIFCMWLHEAHLSKEAKEASVEGEDNEKGKYVAGTTEDTRFITPGQEWMLDNFTLTPINIREGRYWTLVTSMFSHQLPIHAGVNIVVSHFLLTTLCPVFGTIPVGLAFFVGGVSANIMSVAWMGKRGKSVYKEKYPGQFFGVLGMSGGIYAVLGFGGAAYPHWYVDIFHVWPVKISYVVIFAWLFEAFQYWRHTGWEKIQSSVQIILLLFFFC
jgi:membrane associated rhomboid family serine protease